MSSRITSQSRLGDARETSIAMRIVRRIAMLIADVDHIWEEWTQTSAVLAIARTVGNAFAVAAGTAAITRAGRTTTSWTRASFLYRWLTKEPEPEVIVIDLRETVTVGPVIALLDRVLAAATPWIRRSTLGESATATARAVRAAPVRAISLVAFGLLASLPAIVVIALAIIVDDGRPILYSQQRTETFGDTFTVYKFRTMSVGNERSTPTDEETDRITRVGQVLRSTYLDEIPQLWTILIGKMSVVGPRAVWTEEEKHLEQATNNWRKRWFVKPGLTGLAQVNGASSLNPEMKLRYDVEYIRKQSFWFDMKIVIRQLWLALEY